MPHSKLSESAEPLVASFLAQHQKQIAGLGFSFPGDVSRTFGIGALLPDKRQPAGMYLLVLREGLFYIGRAKDVVRRFARSTSMWR